MENEDQGEGAEELEVEDNDKVNPFGENILKDVILTRGVVRKGLSLVRPTVENFKYAYVRYDGSAQDLSNIDILSDFIYLRIVNLSDNRIRTLLPLDTMKHLLVLNAHTNIIESFREIPTWAYIQSMNLMSNNLTSLEGLYANHLVYLQLSFNAFDRLENFDSSTFYTLKTLELRCNQLTSLKGMELPTLENLYMSQNLLTDVEGLDGCPNLRLLHLRHNRISQLESFPNLPKLEYLNLRENEMTLFTQTQHLSNAPKLKVLVLTDNAISTSKRYQIEMMAAIPSLKRLDKELLTESDLVLGNELRSGREKHVEGVQPLVDDLTIVDPPLTTTEEE